MNFENRLIFGEDIDSDKVVCFFETPCRSMSTQCGCRIELSTSSRITRCVDPYGTGGTRPPNIWTGETLSRMSPSMFLE